MRSLKIIKVLNYFNYFILTNILVLGLVIYVPPTSQNYGSKAWGHTLSSVTDLEQLLILIINFFLIPTMLIYENKKILFKSIKRKIIINSYPFNFTFLIFTSISFFF